MPGCLVARGPATLRMPPAMLVASHSRAARRAPRRPDRARTGACRCSGRPPPLAECPGRSPAPEGIARAAGEAPAGCTGRGGRLGGSQPGATGWDGQIEAAWQSHHEGDGPDGLLSSPGRNLQAPLPMLAELELPEHLASKRRPTCSPPGTGYSPPMLQSRLLRGFVETLIARGC